MSTLKDKAAAKRARDKKAMGDEDMMTADEREAYVKEYRKVEPKESKKLFGKAHEKAYAKAKGKTYEEDFDASIELDELKEKKKELLKGISEKSEAEKKKIREKLKELNDKIMELEE